MEARRISLASGGGRAFSLQFLDIDQTHRLVISGKGILVERDRAFFSREQGYAEEVNLPAGSASAHAHMG
jgi:hypothetical protein